MCRHNDLPTLLRAVEISDHGFRKEERIKMVFGLVQNERRVVPGRVRSISARSGGIGNGSSGGARSGEQ